MNDTAWNNNALKAWNEWKDVCAVLRCRPEHRNILTKEITEAFSRKISAVLKGELNHIFSKDNESDSLNWATEFDSRIIEKNGYGKTVKHYKDYIWSLVENSNDAPLKVIRGRLTGPRSIINDIAENYLKNNYNQLWSNCKRATKTTPCVPLEQVAYPTKENSPTIIDIYEAPQKPLGSEFHFENMRKNIEGKFTIVNAAILLVSLAAIWSGKKISFDLPELLTFTQLSKSSCYERYNNDITPELTKALKDMKEELGTIPGSVLFLFNLIKNQIRPEKNAEALLLRLEREMDKQ